MHHGFPVGTNTRRMAEIGRLGDWEIGRLDDFRLSTFDLGPAGLPLSPARRWRERGMARWVTWEAGGSRSFFQEPGRPFVMLRAGSGSAAGGEGKFSRHQAESVLSFAAPSGAERHPVRHRGGLPREINPAQP